MKTSSKKWSVFEDGKLVIKLTEVKADSDSLTVILTSDNIHYYKLTDTQILRGRSKNKINLVIGNGYWTNWHDHF